MEFEGLKDQLIGQFGFDLDKEGIDPLEFTPS